MMGQRSAAPAVVRIIPAVVTNINLVHKIYKGKNCFMNTLSNLITHGLFLQEVVFSKMTSV